VSYRKQRRLAEEAWRNQRLTDAWIAKQGLTAKAPIDRQTALERDIAERQAAQPDRPTNATEAVELLEHLAGLRDRPVRKPSIGAPAPQPTGSTSNMGHIDTAVQLVSAAQEKLPIAMLIAATTDMTEAEQLLIQVGGNAEWAGHVANINQKLIEAQQLILGFSQTLDTYKGHLMASGS